MSLQQKLKAVKGYTASTTETQAAATQLDPGASIHYITTATATDAVKLPKAINGAVCFVLNPTVVTLSVFPASGDAINALAADAFYAQATQKHVLFVCGNDGIWSSIPA